MNINIAGITTRYGGGRALNNVHWSLRAGVTGLLGPNGSGKTTLLSVIVGLTRPTAGTVTVQDTSARFGFMPERFSLPGGVRLADVISYTAWLNGIPPADRDSATHRVLAAVDLTSQADAKVKTLSGGQRQRAGIAAALAHDPDVVVLDEPTAGLDVDQRRRVRELIAEIGRTRPVVMSTHLLDDIAHLCARVGILAGGRIVFDGSVAELEAVAHDQPTNRRRSRIEAGYEHVLATSGSTA